MATETPDMKYRIVATSNAKLGDLIIEDLAGELRLFVGSTGTVSKSGLGQDVVDTLMSAPHWRQRPDSPWFTLDEIRSFVAASTGRRSRLFRGLALASLRI